MNRIVVGVDIAKRVFQLHWVEPATGEIVHAAKTMRQMRARSGRRYSSLGSRWCRSRASRSLHHKCRLQRNA
jgi:hypothetical protein